MQMPPNSDDPRSNRDKDEWLAVVVALGVLGGTAAWILLGGLPSTPLSRVNTGLSDVRTSLSGLALLEDEANTERGAQTLEGGDEGDAEEELPEILGEEGEEASETEDRLDASQANDVAQFDGQLPRPQPDATQPDAAAVAPTSPIVVPDPEPPVEETSEELAVFREPLAFPDIPADYWASPYINVLTARGVLNGLPDGSFAPERAMTRAELATQVAKAFELPADEASQTFSDISADYWAAAEIDEAVTTGFMKGYPDDTFSPSQQVPRVQVLVTLATGLGLAVPAEVAAQLQRYQDQAEIPQWATEKVAAAMAANIITAAPDGETELRPNDDATRAEVAVMLHEALVYAGKLEPLQQ